MPSANKPTVGFCGLGAMGFGVATNLVKKGYTVKGFDVFPKSVEKFKTAGGIGASTLRESAEGVEFYICMVANAQQAQSAIFDDDNAIIKGLPQGSTFLLTSTVPATFAQSAEKQFRERGRSDVYFIDSPVSGGTYRAADGTLTIMAGASTEAIAKGRLLLEEMSNELYIVDGGIGQGSNMKMVHQVLAAIHILAASESMGFAARLGLDAKEVYEHLKVESQDSWAWMYNNRVPRMFIEDYYPGASALTIILKDTSIITQQARITEFPTTLCSTAEQVYHAGLNLGWASHDDAGVIRYYHPEPLKNQHVSDDDKEGKLQLVVDLLSAVYLLSAAEAISFANHVGIPLEQFYALAVGAAGGSTRFRDAGKSMIQGLGGDSNAWRSVDSKTLGALAQRVSKVVAKAQEIKCPLPLGTAVFNQLLTAKASLGEEAGEASALKTYPSTRT